MKFSNIKTILVILCLILLAAGCNKTTKQEPQPISPVTVDPNTTEPPAQPTVPEQGIHTIQFTAYNPVFRFQSQIPEQWKVEYAPEIESINVYNPSAPGSTSREQSQIFIRYFTANSFLTLSTVDILQRLDTNVSGHAAVEYEIKKKPGVANFPHQPLWRNEQHKLIDIRLIKQNPSVFYVFASNPALSENTFQAFINSLTFHNDLQSFTWPIDKALERITKKPFGIKVSPQNSPVSPERFSGYHNAVDFEAFSDEANADVQLYTICGGKLLQKKTVSGYGGVVVQECVLDNEPITVIYGHVRLTSIAASVGDYISPGNKLGLLGTGFSSETDGERKHLHLGIHRGTKVDIRGYVTTEKELAEWINATELIGNK